jgi:hydrogenase-4 component B
MSGEQLFVIGAAIAAISGLPGLGLGRLSLWGQRIAAVLILAGNLCVAAGISRYLATGQGQTFVLPSPIPGANFVWEFDALSVIFVLPVCLLSSLCAIYALSYWKQTEHPENGQKMWFFFGLLIACMETLVVAHSGILFLFAWEGMAICAFFLVATEDQDEETRNAGWLFLGASHFATLCLFALFSLMANVNGTFGWDSLANASPAMQTAIFIMALLGFGLKAGIMPLHVWLPSAHAMAPSHVSAMMSGMLIKMGIYGLVRVTSLVPVPPIWWGGLLLSLGVVSGVAGLAFAIGQRDLKRMLAYSSIENIGVITMGIGLALIGRSLGQVEWVVLGMGGALLHVWNHACFKSMLFLCSGAIIHGAHTRQIDLLGGLSKRMPRIALCFLIGSLAACGLPPLNGFVSEFMIYIGLFKTLGLDRGPSWPAAAFAVPGLAFIGALAVACFMKLFGIMFLGTARSEPAAQAREASPWMVLPTYVLAACCVVIGIFPTWVAPLIEAGVADWDPQAVGPATRLAVLAPLQSITNGAVVLIGFLIVSSLLLAWRLRVGKFTLTNTWGCGYLAPTARMQYTGSSFGEILVKLFGWLIFPRTNAPQIRALFPPTAKFQSNVPDAVLNSLVLPSFRFCSWIFSWFRLLQQGSIHAYLMYIFLIVVVLLLWQ